MRNNNILLLMVLLTNINAAGLVFADSLCLKDGSQLKGKILKMDAQQIEFETIGGILKIPQANVATFVSGESDIKPLPIENKPSVDQSLSAQPDTDESFALYKGRTFFSERTLGLGFAGGFTSGSGFSAIFHFSPVAFVLSGFPMTDGYNVGVQLQVDLVQFQYQRFHTYAGTSIYSLNNKVTQPFGLGLGYSWISSNFIGFTLNGGVQGGRNPDDSKLYWYPDLNAMIHFYVN